MLLAGLPPLVRDGDRFRAGVHRAQRVAARRRASRRRAVRAGAGARRRPLAAQDVALAPGEARELGWDVTVPAGADAARLAGRARRARVDGARRAVRDALKVAQKVVAAVPERTFQATICSSTRRATIAGASARPTRCPAAAASTCSMQAEARAATCPACASISSAIRTPASSSRPRRRSVLRDRAALGCADGARCPTISTATAWSSTSRCCATATTR